MALRIQRQANPLWVFEVYHRRLLIALSVLAVAGWLLVVSSLFLWLDRQPHNQVGWFDLAAPWRWAELRAKRGDTAIQAALAELKARDYTSAFYNLRVGLSRSPGNVEGRVTLARLFAGQDPARAVATLEEGLPYASRDPKLIGALLTVYGTYRMHSHGLAFIEQQLAVQPPLPVETQRQLARARVEFLIELGRLDDAGKAAAAVPVPDAAPQRSVSPLEVELQLRLGHPAEARRLLAPILSGSVVSSVAWRQAVDVAVALGDADGVTSALRHLRAAAPEDPWAYLLAFKAWHQLQRFSLRDGAEQDYYRLFRTKDGALQAFAAQAVLLDLPDAVLRAQRAAAAARLSPFAFRVHRTELALRRGEIEEATRLLREWEHEVDTLGATQRFHPEFIKRLARAAFAGTPDQAAFLAAHLSAARGFAQLGVYQLALSVLEKSGNPAGAAEIARAGLQVYPRSDPLLVAERRLAEAAAVAVARTSETAAGRGPVIALPNSAAAARRQLDELMQQDSLAAVRDLIRGIRAQKPAWLAATEVDLALREVELAYLTLDQIASRAAARAFLDRRREEGDVLELAKVAQRLAGRGQGAEARLLAIEIKGAAPANLRVQQALREISVAEETSGPRTQAETLRALDAAIAAQQWADAESLLKPLRDNPPDWLTGAAVAIRVREVEVRVGLGQRPLALAALKELVVKAGAPRSAAFKLVRDFAGRGERDTALVLAREIVRLLPDDAAAARLLREAETPRPRT